MSNSDEYLNLDVEYGSLLKRNAFRLSIFVVLALVAFADRAFCDDNIKFSTATIVTDQNAHVLVQTAAQVLREEIGKRSLIKLKTGHRWTKSGWSIIIVAPGTSVIDGVTSPHVDVIGRAESFAIQVDNRIATRPILWIIGSDPRGVFYGVGWILRKAHIHELNIELNVVSGLHSSPQVPIRGHQLGYRATANSYDAWTPAQFDQYIRELAIFGCNSVEGIPFQDTRPTVNPYPRAKMNVDLSRICQKYGQDYWIWTPADFDLKNEAFRKEALRKHEELFRQCPELTGVFVPGGDPGDNPANLVIPYLNDLSKLLLSTHPKARVWVSMQGYKKEEQEVVYHWIETEKPSWLGGLVAGPSSPPLNVIRARLPKQYKLRDYPDITHNTRSQFGIPWWDPAFAMTLGRESVNPRPVFFQRIIHDTAIFTDGFISYSDGIHDDVNKIVWSALAWDRDADISNILQEYCRFFFGEKYAAASSGLSALERNWEGPAATNGGIVTTRSFWSGMDQNNQLSQTNWRWQLCMLRSAYDLFVQKRLDIETSLEKQANGELLRSDIPNHLKEYNAIEALNSTRSYNALKPLKIKITQLCEALYRSIGLQTSVGKYRASGSERGAILDFIDYPLNNKYWIEDEIGKAFKLPTEREKDAYLHRIATWEHPGKGSYYDAIGHVGKSPHEIRNEKLDGPLLDFDDSVPTGMMFWTGNNPLARVRQTWFSYETWPKALVYTDVDKNSDYKVRITGYGDCLLRVNGTRVKPTIDGRQVGEIKEFEIPHELFQEGRITLTFDTPFEPGVNWRQQSRLTEVWLIKK
ncbi:MAG: hypothetical protein ABJA67_15240 [Chthonomonadales bacterium]